VAERTSDTAVLRVSAHSLPASTCGPARVPPAEPHARTTTAAGDDAKAAAKTDGQSARPLLVFTGAAGTPLPDATTGSARARALDELRDILKGGW
jgi:hypothetical protein